MYTKILTPLDGSSYGECVLDHVKTVAAGCKAAEVVLLYVAEPMNPGIYDVPPDFLEDVKKRGIDTGRKYVDQLADSLNKDGLFTSTAVVYGNPVDVILDYIKAHGIDLVVMSTHGRSGVTRWALGSVTDKVIHQSQVPVLIVSPPGCRISKTLS